MPLLSAPRPPALASGRRLPDQGALKGSGLGSIALLLALTGCGPRPPFPVQTLADAGLKPLPAERLEACAAKLGLPPEQARPADATNFGERQRLDAFGRTRRS
jgi:hypothetical protein